MAGQSQAVNLGGMLSQLGQTLGTPVSTDSLTGPIKNMFRPGIDPQDPASIRQAAEYQMKIGNTDQAALYTKQAEIMAEKQKEAAQQAAQAQLSSLQVGMQNLLDSNAPADQKAKGLQSLQQAANTVAAKAGIASPAVAGMSQALQDKKRARDSMASQERRAEEGLKLQYKASLRSEEAAQQAADRHRDWLDNAKFREARTAFEQDTMRYKDMSRKVQAAANSPAQEKQFLMQYGEEGKAMLDAVRQENETKRLQIENLRASVGKPDFQFESEINAEGFPPAVKKWIEAKREAGGGAAANRAYVAYMEDQATKRRQLPTAAMANLFRNAATSILMESLPGSGWGGWDAEDDEIKSAAARAGGLAAEALTTGASYDEALMIGVQQVLQQNQEASSDVVSLEELTARADEMLKELKAKEGNK